MKKFTMFIAVLIGIAVGFVLHETVLAAPEKGSVEFYEELVENMETIQIVNSDDLTMEMLQNRKGTIIIEKCIGMMTDAEGNGRVLNCANPDYYYISYKSVKNANIGDIILTYFVYNPDNNIEDDIIERFDFIIDK